MIQLISDLHLSADDPALLDQFRQYVAQLESGDELYILGDLFEYWLGDDAVEFLGHLQAERLLSSISDRGVQLNFLTGNRDFLLGRSFADRCGMNLIADEHILNVGAERILLMHGDRLCTDDIAHQQFRTMVRTPSWQEGFLAKPLVERDAMAKLARYRSEDGKAAKTPQIMDVNSTAVDEVMRAHRVRILIHGHTHRPAVHEIGSADGAYRIVLGDWAPGPSWIRLTETGLELQFAGTCKRLAFRGGANGRR
ncbi:MAG TPA: UDP-2,3-diacylglucosamine diphosphatase [Gammaproteobacteria bacterium]|nr:UDP-2,3-diacylglucosamine diphosphatase [Acidiferrobacteraceae bacterium]MDP6552397.1 UDP-2,3-diacylglucosamine diphosphatase [Arenicellales bacterium]MDP6790315.1 UDP-2,3-diacylglucosamine diphosphatase [Arenicellales bacterium]MDP6918211.1 UDP-2,3-diacylglucosamine diphosphatase [Arenicellales bacterium]HCX88710.1 UDP-2,3-diacylglucosamine diphosphatase [Gammaproteobacteria bacterium]